MAKKPNLYKQADVKFMLKDLGNEIAELVTKVANDLKDDGNPSGAKVVSLLRKDIKAMFKNEIDAPRIDVYEEN
jgi:hypothetical protein